MINPDLDIKVISIIEDLPNGEFFQLVLWSCVFFSQSEYEMNHGPLNLIPQSYQDDSIRVCKNPDLAQFGLGIYENLAETKLLSNNLDKSMTVVVGPKSQELNL